MGKELGTLSEKEGVRSEEEWGDNVNRGVLFGGEKKQCLQGVEQVTERRQPLIKEGEKKEEDLRLCSEAVENVAKQGRQQTVDSMLVDLTVKGVTEQEDRVSNKLIHKHNVGDQCPRTRLPLQDCTNSTGVVGELSVNDQKKGTKGQWKRRARMQHMENKEVELQEVG